MLKRAGGVGRLGQPPGVLGRRPALLWDYKAATSLSTIPRLGPTPTYSRGSKAWARGRDGLIRELATDEPALTYDPSGNPLGYHHHPSYTNVLLDSRDLSTGNWARSATVTQNATGVDGQANKAWTVAAPSTTSSDTLIQDKTVSVDNATHTSVFRIKKDNDESRFPEVNAVIFGGTSVKQQVQINTKTGNTVTRTSDGSYEIVDEGEWWKLTLVVTNNGTAGNDTLRYRIYPAITTTLGVTEASATGSVIYDAGGIFLNSFTAPDYPIFTGASAVTINEPSQTTPVNGAGEPDVSGGCTIVVRDSMDNEGDTPSKRLWGWRLEDGSQNDGGNIIGFRADEVDKNIQVFENDSVLTNPAEFFTVDGNPHTRVLRIGPNGATVWEDGSQVYSDSKDYSTVLSNVTDFRVGYQVQGEYEFARLYTGLLPDNECLRLSNET